MDDLHKALFNLSVSFYDFSKALVPVSEKMEELKEELEELDRLRMRRRILIIRIIMLFVVFLLCISYFIWKICLWS